ncbi:MAG: hypothetical protein QNJ72_13605 [Pleurocapsa sp. MO_226.B13]|nr:hypothetical protein [Pleurocapsa sp. MO_226.B13]
MKRLQISKHHLANIIGLGTIAWGKIEDNHGDRHFTRDLKNDCCLKRQN